MKIRFLLLLKIILFYIILKKGRRFYCLQIIITLKNSETRIRFSNMCL